MKTIDIIKEPRSCLITGVAGFIGSHLARRLLAQGCTVVGVDIFTDYYDREVKENNIADLLPQAGFTLLEQDLAEADENIFEGVQWVFHQAAQAGVRASWGREFSHYSHHNVLGTQRLLERARHSEIEKFIYASSSSIYGDSGKLPMQEDDLPRPMSPYGVTKLAAEHLCNLYRQNFQVPAVSLRYFTVYGPNQRPDMAFHRFIRAILEGRDVVVYGSGEQTRDFTYIDDIVAANIAAALAGGVEGKVFNIGGGSRISVNGVLEMLGRITGKAVRIKHEGVQAGDPPHTYADTSRARAELGYRPQVSLEEGLRRMYESFL